MQNLERSKAPDGGWGWVVVLAAFSVHLIAGQYLSESYKRRNYFIADGITFTTGLFYKAWLDHFNSSSVMTSSVISIMAGSTPMSGPFAAILMNAFGCRAVGSLGALLATAGLSLTAISPNMVTLLFTFGLMTGFGLGFLCMSATIVLMEYFDKKIALASGIASCGTGIGMLVFGPLIEHKIEENGWMFAVWIIALITVTNFLWTFLFYPLKYIKFDSFKVLATGLKRLAAADIPRNVFRKATSDSVGSVTRTKSNSMTMHLKPSTWGVLKRSVREVVGSLKKVSKLEFFGHASATFFGASGSMVPMIYIKVKAVQLQSPTWTSILLGAMGAGTTVGRVIFGFLADFCSRKNRMVLFSWCFLACGVLTVAAIYCRTFGMFTFFCFVYGITWGGTVALIPITLSDSFGVQYVAHMFGIMAVFEGLGTMIGPAVIGIINSSSYDAEFVTAGLCLLVAGLLMYTTVFLRDE